MSDWPGSAPVPRGLLSLAPPNQRGFYSEAVDYEVSAAIRAAGSSKRGPRHAFRQQPQPAPPRLYRSLSASEIKKQRQKMKMPALAVPSNPPQQQQHLGMQDAVGSVVRWHRRRRLFAAQHVGALLHERGVVLNAAQEAGGPRHRRHSPPRALLPPRLQRQSRRVRRKLSRNRSRQRRR